MTTDDQADYNLEEEEPPAVCNPGREEQAVRTVSDRGKDKQIIVG